MKFSHNWLQTFFTEALPAPEILADKITAHSSEIEEVISLPNDTVYDVKILPDKSAWLMSHRGLAKEISVILNIPLTKDPFNIGLISVGENIKVKLSSATCDFYGAALIEGVTVGPSPLWLKEALEAVGQRSINNIVDATNYVMFELGQPLHAFDAGKLNKIENKYGIEVRQAKAEESIVTLTGESYILTPEDTIITDSSNGQPIGIAGIKGGKFAAVEANTTTILLEAAHFNRFAVRSSSKRLKLATDASKRYENGISASVAPFALAQVIAIILKVAGGDCVGNMVIGEASVVRLPVTCSIQKINSVLGLSLTTKEIDSILERFGFEYGWEGDLLSVTPTFERDDIVIAEDLIEEIGRMHGLHHVVSVLPLADTVNELNKRHFYAEKIRTVLIDLGFSEVYTSSFCSHDTVKLENALASDKGYLRSTLTTNILGALERNISHRDLLGLLSIKLFEIGTVFAEDSEEFRVGLAVQTGTSYKAKVDDLLLAESLETINNILGVKPSVTLSAEGTAEFSLDAILPQLPMPTAYEKVEINATAKYQAFSIYPAIVRDIAMWVSAETNVEKVKDLISETAGTLLKRVTLFDEFNKEGKTSLAFRLVFQSFDKTLTDAEVESAMNNVYKSVLNQGWEVR